MVFDDVTEVTLTGHLKRVVTGAGDTHEAPAVILATGSAYKELGLPEEKKLSGHGVSWCATCDGFFFRDQDIIVVGGGDSAMEEATFLTRFGKSVTVVVRKDELRASRIMAQRAKDNPKISFAWNSAITKIHGDAKVTGVTLTDTRTGETREQAATGIFVAIGHVPRTELVAGQIDLDAEGYIKVDSPTTVTNLTGVFACGDAVDHRYRQAITAAGTGCAAALDAERYLAALEDATASPPHWSKNHHADPLGRGELNEHRMLATVAATRSGLLLHPACRPTRTGRHPTKPPPTDETEDSHGFSEEPSRRSHRRRPRGPGRRGPPARTRPRTR